MTRANPTPEDPVRLNALIALAQRLHRAGRLDEAATAYRAILARRPDFAEVHNNLGDILWRQGSADQSLSHFQQALALRPNYVQAHNNLGNLLLSQGKFDRAAACYNQAIALRPDYVEAHNNLGITLQQQGYFDRAVARFEHAIALRPNYADAHYNLGNALKLQGKLDRAAACYNQALAIQPDHGEAHNNLGDTLRQQGKHEQALAQFEQALALRPQYLSAIKNLGLTLRDQLRLNEARQAFERLESLQPHLPDAQLGLATCYLLEGDFERGWPAYEARLRMPELAMPTSLLRWRGEPLAARSLLLVAEQGLGDTLHFVRYARIFKRLGARVVLAAHPALGPLLASCRDVDELCLLGSGEWPQCDFYLPLLSAPGALETTAATVPCEIPYLSTDPELADRWHRELAEIDGFKIGIAWQGARDFSVDRQRSIPLAQFAPLARVPGVRLISLQKGFGSQQIAAVGFPVLDFSDRLDEAAGPFMDTAAVIHGVDLVITSDTAIPHLAGALGAPVWVALPFSPDWRWQLRRGDSPWYPTMRLFRQATSGAWPDVFACIADAVQARRAESASAIPARNESL